LLPLETAISSGFDGGGNVFSRLESPDSELAKEDETSSMKDGLLKGKAPNIV
jgi:hypothetical protein